jgi:hypothetical protein
VQRIIFSVGLVLLLVVWPGCSRAENINPDIFPAFRRVEIYAMLYVERPNVNLKEYQRCQNILKAMDQADKAMFSPAKKYYHKLRSLGVSLPPLTLSQPATDARHRAARAENERLRQQQADITERLLLREMRDFESGAMVDRLVREAERGY